MLPEALLNAYYPGFPPDDLNVYGVNPNSTPTDFSVRYLLTSNMSFVDVSGFSYMYKLRFVVCNTPRIPADNDKIVEPIKFGVVSGFFNNPLYDVTQDCYLGTLAHLRAVNAHGGIQGRIISTIPVGDKYSGMLTELGVSRVCGNFYFLPIFLDARGVSRNCRTPHSSWNFS